MRCLLASVTLLATFNLSFSQPNRDVIEVGKPCPNFKLNDVTHYTKTEASLRDFRGKWLVLDFWTSGCKACIYAFPKLSMLQAEFSEDIQFVLVGKNDKKYNVGIRSMYEAFQKKQNLQLTVAYDSLLFSRFEVTTVPHIVIIDRVGIVRAITGGSTLTRENFLSLIKDGSNLFSSKVRKGHSLKSWPQEADTAFLFRSMLGKWDRNVLQQVMPNIDDMVEEGYYKGTGMLLRWLYNLAYFGVNHFKFNDPRYNFCSSFPVLEIKDSSIFDYDFATEKGLYNYSLTVPKEVASKEHLQEIMQRDLKNYFGFEVSIEMRKVSYWKLTASKKSLDSLKTAGSPYSRVGNHAGLSFTNIPIKKLLSTIQSYHQFDGPFVDETGFTENIDISLNVILNDLEEIKRGLRENGLQLIRAKRDMKVLVLKDKTY